MSSSLIFYKQEFNANVYDDLSRIHSYSQSVWISSDEILKKENVTVEELSSIKLNFDEIFQNLQSLNSKAFRYSSSSGINLINHTNLSSQLANMRIKYLEETRPMTLTEEEIDTLIEIKDTFKNLADIIYENLDGVEQTSLGVPNVLRNDLWLNIIKTIKSENYKFYY